MVKEGKLPGGEIRDIGDIGDIRDIGGIGEGEQIFHAKRYE